MRKSRLRRLPNRRTVEKNLNNEEKPARLCQNRRSLFCNMLKNIKQSPDFHKPGLCHVIKFL